MNDVAIRVENLGKQYRIGGQQKGYKRFTETAMDTLTAPVRRLRNLGKSASPAETFWALQDVSLEIRRGEAVGIIGRNGAGKSTLLKILSRITEPTTGRVELYGRVASLLEVGTGFHPELTGRENVYLNGAILGMRRAEIDRKFDEIVAFSGVERFLDTPVKRYSSGMQVRLAFAVAAHLDPEILLVDEVLAVGDAEFQKKCLGKMGEVASGGRTVLFVSHNMGAIRSLCKRGVYLSSGNIAFDGSVSDALVEYGDDLDIINNTNRDQFPVESKCKSIKIENITIEYVGEDLLVRINVVATCLLQQVGVGFDIRKPDGEIVASQGAIHSNAYVYDVIGPKIMTLRLKEVVRVLNGGDYRLGIWLARSGGEKYLDLADVCKISIPYKTILESSRALTLVKNGPLFVSSHFESVDALISD